MVERGNGTRLLLKAVQPFGVLREGVRQHLDGDIALQTRVSRAEDLSHAAFTQQRANFIRPEPGAWFEGHNLARSALACCRTGSSGSAFFQKSKNLV